MFRRSVLAIGLALFTFAAWPADKADLVVIKKAEARLYLQRAGKSFASFRVVFGANPKGHKQQQGDSRTPEGHYVLDWKNPNSSYYRSIHISYPNERDLAAAKARGVDPGGDIMIHGQPNGWLGPALQRRNWTDGCVALTDADMEQVWNAVEPGTPIRIDP